MVNEQACMLTIVDALNAMGVPYLLVGSFSTNLYGIPRSTKDADFVIELSGRSIVELKKYLPTEFRLDPQLSFENVTGTKKNEISIVGTAFTIELFRLSDDPHDQERFRRRQPVAIAGRTVFFPTVEDVLVTKLRWANIARRSKDLDDLRNVIGLQHKVIDWTYVETWCAAHETGELLRSLRKDVEPPDDTTT